MFATADNLIRLVTHGLLGKVTGAAFSLETHANGIFASWDQSTSDFGLSRVCSNRNRQVSGHCRTQNRLGDWEDDTVVSAGYKGGLLTLVGRKTNQPKSSSLNRRSELRGEQGISRQSASAAIS